MLMTTVTLFMMALTVAPAEAKTCSVGNLVCADSTARAEKATGCATNALCYKGQANGHGSGLGDFGLVEMRGTVIGLPAYETCDWSRIGGGQCDTPTVTHFGLWTGGPDTSCVVITTQTTSTLGVIPDPAQAKCR